MFCSDEIKNMKIKRKKLNVVTNKTSSLRVLSAVEVWED